MIWFTIHLVKFYFLLNILIVLKYILGQCFMINVYMLKNQFHPSPTPKDAIDIRVKKPVR